MRVIGLVWDAGHVGFICSWRRNRGISRMTALDILKTNWLWGSRKIREGLAGILPVFVGNVLSVSVHC